MNNTLSISYFYVYQASNSFFPRSPPLTPFSYMCTVLFFKRVDIKGRSSENGCIYDTVRGSGSFTFLVFLLLRLKNHTQ